MIPLCPFSTDTSSGINKLLYCDILNSPCAYYRWCITDSRIKMTDKYNTCMIKENEMKKKMATNLDIEVENKEEIISEVIEETKDTEEGVEIKQEKKLKTTTETCKVTLVKNNNIYFTLDNCGMKYEFYDIKIGENVKVEYVGKVGNKDFKIVNVSK